MAAKGESSSKKVTLRCDGSVRKLVSGPFSKHIESLEFVEMAAETERVSYAMEKVEEENPKVQYALGVYDAETKTIKLSRTEVFQLVVTPKRVVEDSVEVDRSLEGRIKMAERFGTAKKQKQLKARLANKIQVDDGTAADLEETFDALRKDERKITTERRVAAGNAPTRNSRAETPSDMYDWNDLFHFEDLLDQIEALDKFHSGLPRNPENLLLRHMIVFYKEKDRGTLRVAEYSRSKNIPEKIVKRFLDQYATVQADGNYSRPTALRNKLAMHVLLLALKVNDFTLDTKDFAETLGSEPSRLAPFLKELGCDIYKHSAQLVVESKKIKKRRAPSSSRDEEDASSGANGKKKKKKAVH